MKILKELSQGLLLHFFGQRTQQNLSVGCLYFYDLSDPGDLLPETEMWPFLQQELGQTLFDTGLPKPYGEVLVWGKCFPPDGRPAPAAVAGLRVGPVCKELAVYGTRYWRKNAAGDAVSDPAPFSVMDLGYQNAFGGPSYTRNPLGKGIEAVRTDSGDVGIPLPNVEDPDRCVGSLQDRPDPAGFGPLALDWPQRKNKFGTYDARWLNERWPFFPEDADWTFANAANPDQRLTQDYNNGFFKGDEVIRMTNMHPARAVYDSALPSVRPRCFIDQYEKCCDPHAKTFFREITLRPETLWLFPHAERGILLFRGAAEVADDEGLDIKSVYLDQEAREDTPQLLDYYQMRFLEQLKRGVPMDTAPLEEAEHLMQQAEKNLAELPSIVRDAVDGVLGRTPEKSHTPDELAALAQQSIQKHKALLAEVAPLLEETRKQFGHLVKVDTQALGNLEQTLDSLGETAQKLAAAHQEAHAKVAEATQLAEQEMQQGLGNHPLPNAGLPQDEPVDLHVTDVPLPPEERWQRRAIRFVQECKEHLRGPSEFKEYLHWIGFTDRTIERSWFGFNPYDRTESSFEWGLVDSKDQDEPFEILSGMVQPSFDGPELRTVMLRPHAGHFDYLGKTLKGSREKLGYTRIVPGRPVVVTHFSIEYWLLRQEAEHLCEPLTLGSPDMELSSELQQALAEAPQLIALQYPPHPHADVPSFPLEAWQKLHPQVELVPIPRGGLLIQARYMGVRIEKWLRGLIKPELLPDESMTLQDRLDPKIDIPATVKQKITNARAAVLAKFDASQAEASAHLEEAKEELAKVQPNHGIPDDLFGKPPGPQQSTDTQALFKECKETASQQVAELKKQLKNLPPAPEAQKDLAEAVADLDTFANTDLDQTAATVKDATARLQTAMDKLNAGPPEWTRKLMLDLGKNPDDLGAPDRLTREDVIRYLKEERSLSGKNISELDLSGLDFSGQNLRGADMQKSVFTGSTLDNADLSEALANEADFSNTRMLGTNLRASLLQNAKFTGSTLTGADLSHSLLSEAALSKADLTMADLSGATLEKADCADALFAECSARQTTFIETNLADSVWKQADLGGSTFIDSTLDQCDFSRADASSVNCIGTSGQRVNFANANLTNIRLLSGSALPDADLSGAQAERACFKEADLTGCNFRKAGLRRAMIEDCDCAGANFTGAHAVEARLNRSSFTFSLLTGVNLMHGSVRKARLADADLSYSNLFGAEFYKALVYNTRAEEANLKRTKLEKLADSSFLANKK